MNREYIKGLVIGTAGAITAVIMLQMTGSHILSVGDGVLSKKEYVNKIEYLEKMIEENYLGDYTEDDLAEGIYAGLVAGLKDPYSCYYTEEEYEAENTATEGSYVGIGVVLQQREEGGIEIVECYEGGPGYEAGLVPGDLIVEADGEDITEWDTAQLVELIRKGKKDHVVLTVYPKESSEAKEVDIPITDVQIPAVKYEMLDEHVGYIKIIEFTGVAPEQYRNAFKELEAQQMEKLVIDLRNNPGGLLDSVCEILEEILPEGLIVSIRDQRGESRDIYSEGKHVLEIPLAVLINGSSASASEIFAGAVKDYEIGTLVGTTTFGKGIVQAIQPLNDGSALKLTIADYYTPKGNNIHKVGIEPDVEVKLDDSLLNRTDYTYEEDNQLGEALHVLNSQKISRNTE